MGRSVGMVHAISSNVRLFNELTFGIMPGVEVVHLVDEGLLLLSNKQYHECIVQRLGVLSSQKRRNWLVCPPCSPPPCPI